MLVTHNYNTKGKLIERKREADTFAITLKTLASLHQYFADQ